MTPGGARRFWRGLAGVVAGGVLGGAMAVLASTAARSTWPAYAQAEPTRAYSVAMLVGRLIAGAVCVAAGAAVSTRVARDSGGAARVLGAIVFAISLEHHVVDVWPDYPVWYHLVYLGYILPIAALVGAHAAPEGRQ